MGCILRRQLYQIEKDKVNIWDTLLEHPKDRHSLSNKIVKLRYFTMLIIWIALRDAVYWSDWPHMGSLLHLGVETCRRPCVSIGRARFGGGAAKSPFRLQNNFSTGSTGEVMSLDSVLPANDIIWDHADLQANINRMQLHTMEWVLCVSALHPSNTTWPTRTGGNSQQTRNYLRNTVGSLQAKKEWYKSTNCHNRICCCYVADVKW